MPALDAFGFANPEQAHRDLELLVDSAGRQQSRGAAAGLVEETAVFVLAGGRGERLYPLTRNTTKGAVPFAGTYRLIDFSLSNCLHSQLRKIWVLPQHQSQSLEQYLRSGWVQIMDQIGHGLIVLPPPYHLTAGGYMGTADAIYRNISILKQWRPRMVLVLAADHLYKMEYGRLLAYHLQQSPAVTLVGTEVPSEQAVHFGTIKAKPGGRVVGFAEKQPAPPRSKPVLASMGIYVFDTEALVAALSEDARSSASHHDFGRDVIPRMVAQGQRVFAYNADEEQGRDSFYWRDIGVIDSYWEASMELLEDDSPFDLFDRNWPIYSYQPVSPPARVLHQETPGSGLDRSLLSPGVTISGARVDRSILSPGVRIERGAEVTESVLLDGVHVGEGARIHRAIIGANVTVPQDYSVGVNAERDRMRFDISPNGVVVVAGITPRDDLERFLSPYSFEMAPMGAGSN